MAVTLGKDVTISGISNARTVTVNNSAAEVDVTKFGDTSRKFRKALIEQTVEVECVDSPGVDAGDTFTLSGAGTGNVVYVVTNVAEADPIDGIKTFTVSASRNHSQS
jgi:Tfp pilus assembly protein PilW